MHHEKTWNSMHFVYKKVDEYKVLLYPEYIRVMQDFHFCIATLFYRTLAL